MCKKGKDTAKFMLEWLQNGAFAGHLESGCPDMECPALVRYEIIAEKCTMCDLCRDVCKDNAILGEKRKPYQSGYRPFEIRQKRCTKCGKCVKVCPERAIEIIQIRETAEAAAGKR